MRLRPYLWLTVPVVALSGCSPSEVDVLKALPMPFSGQQMTVQAAFEKHVNCVNTKWKAFEDRTVTKVKVMCEVKDLDSLRDHLLALERTADEQATQRFKNRQIQSMNELQRSIETLKERIESAKKKTFTYTPLESLPKYDRYRMNCDEYAEKAQHPLKRIERNEQSVAKFCTEGSKTYSALFCDQARNRYNTEVPKLKERVQNYMRDMEACKAQRKEDKERLQAINEERAQRVKEAEVRHEELIKGYEADVARKEAQFIEVKNRVTDDAYEADRAANAKLAGLHKLKSLEMQFVFRMTVDRKEAIIESVNTRFAWNGFEAPLYQHIPTHPLGYDGSDVISAMLRNSKVWNCGDNAMLCRKIDNTIVPIYIAR